MSRPWRLLTDFRRPIELSVGSLVDPNDLDAEQLGRQVAELRGEIGASERALALDDLSIVDFYQRS